MNMTFEQYISNPMGKNNAILSNVTRESIRRDYTTRFNNVLLRENGRIDYYFYKDEKKNAYYVHIKIPSEVIANFYYDVVIKFFTDSSVADNGRNLEKYFIQFYSNDPAFVFTYAHTFMKNGLFISELSPKMSKSAIKYSAKEKNPHDINGYVKSIFFAYLFMKERGLFNKLNFGGAPAFNSVTLLNNIEDADSKIEKRQKEEEKRDKRKKVVLDKDTANKVQRIGGNNETIINRIVTTTRTTSAVKKTKATNSTSNKFIKTTKRK